MRDCVASEHGTNRTTVKIAAALVCAIFAAIFLLSTAFIALNSNHEHNHIGENGTCAACARFVGAKRNIIVHIKPGALFDRTKAEKRDAPNQTPEITPSPTFATPNPAASPRYPERSREEIFGIADNNTPIDDLVTIIYPKGEIEPLIRAGFYDDIA